MLSRASSLLDFPYSPARKLIARHVFQAGIDMQITTDTQMACWGLKFFSGVVTERNSDRLCNGPAAVYEQGLKAGIYRKDPRQHVTIQKLQNLFDHIKEHADKPRLGRKRLSGLTMVESVHKKDTDSIWGGLSGLLVRKKGSLSRGGSSTAAAAQPLVPPLIRGLYMYGGVGCGKTMLMDLFANEAPAGFKVHRTHFHDFMLGIHNKLRNFKGKDDQVLRVADQIAQDTKVLALDEFFVTDVADAMILSRLFGRLWDHGLVLVATSNRAPDKLYEGGLQRSLFLPFIERLKVECEAHDMISPTDYRRLAKHQRGLYFTSQEREEELNEEFVDLAHGEEPTPQVVEVMMGRQINVPLAAGKICNFSFDDLCGRPVAAADYLALVEHYHTIALSGVPIITAATRSEGYRFVTLIDVLYEHRVRMLISAEASPFELFENIVTQQEAEERPHLKDRKDIIIDDNLGFSKERTISRLTEMQSTEYLVAHAQNHAPENLLALQEAQSKKQ
ncbi:hypothetical protein CEUSTIGMA_g2312.t1 [Chlamydomonas eustigma]|uniref:AAA+ ATPase domain-containing protein n=1 Tax=Chlamydomonas eustigma TaxID=1157962 RepID=A0A250WVS4_9CHLO|nr:hypothetical protein CEUSTIGMA_g2312.t1 [Chlamydomonas eustigma]|eukprot:GAX74866.1 hypothetical protein CEUSTIGMA_g2312.t1 [Chlamydomonas eustigma]